MFTTISATTAKRFLKDNQGQFVYDESKCRVKWRLTLDWDGKKKFRVVKRTDNPKMQEPDYDVAFELKELRELLNRAAKRPIGLSTTQKAQLKSELGNLAV
jgi:hypothetical protein